jgi:hypothetical protein
MTIESEFQIWNVQATEAIGGDKLFKVASIAGTVAAGNALAIGITRGTGAVGAQIPVVFKGITKAFAGAVVTTPGFPLKVAATSGYIVAAASGDGHIGRYLGLAACASGDLVPVVVDFSTKPAWAGI